ncbi:hypothetical protein HDF08_003508 [Edaphobacter lichenicola]|uniref:Uncharacterized protein n=1 Tax=Tunturiibacter lichenicola TaxID=2051959 RepID=A0A852VP83_9BACT|nr:hypothetical protein [Edaphobacter lichenicola]
MLLAALRTKALPIVSRDEPNEQGENHSSDNRDHNAHNEAMISDTAETNMRGDEPSGQGTDDPETISIKTPKLDPFMILPVSQPATMPMMIRHSRRTAAPPVCSRASRIKFRASSGASLRSLPGKFVSWCSVLRSGATLLIAALATFALLPKTLVSTGNADEEEEEGLANLLPAFRIAT